MLARMQTGDSEAFAALYRKYWRRLFDAAYRRILLREESEEIIQEIFVDLWAKRETLLISVSLEAYLFGALRYSIYNLIRSRKIREAYLEHLLQVPGDQNNYIEDRLHYEELARALESSVQNLPEKLRKVYLLSRKEHLTYKEIAEQEQIPVDTVEKQMGRALKILRENLKEFAWAWIVLEMWNLYP
ncbi:RNA polymerase sigma-70 factor (ECF subfamily) [Dyadobacter sp. BE34]|uniref:RNA polymerase sigma-70 factor (ECF subfamily) n=1 Tax=Dyadobacter fermentans TaxID=94254 RepID=A0ABU1QT80_9BACT|nr:MULTISPECIES: RNA polymerase sigma-70 factor [Dyadobacter]MDR6804357.1 RNA polymerase sigma-70 factor (ECF subfamily) [Dyadobacter fermentans]MDR7042097.1 RNA polymerase sigma-70 factor (ECF subfamily) [Dyadobacter sp. BE242]MDR7196500.1 RNA polymerase sigma-70 factor (ECF subfamily) [Dyadobacter sp. BE34]MDR7212955.1 RNA polymerase sigma-70 factor (ECF subfamily) [Dyadobacter sp. BE31]MDR7261906.1 RNA polymerase sigma-70 factor (ECF subfamily) [Dyadobacter sp. BE32]